MQREGIRRTEKEEREQPSVCHQIRQTDHFPEIEQLCLGCLLHSCFNCTVNYFLSNVSRENCMLQHKQGRMYDVVWSADLIYVNYGRTAVSPGKRSAINFCAGYQNHPCGIEGFPRTCAQQGLEHVLPWCDVCAVYGHFVYLEIQKRRHGQHSVSSTGGKKWTLTGSRG